MDEKPPIPMVNWGQKPKDQFNKKLPNSVRNWGGKPKNWWQCATHR